MISVIKLSDIIPQEYEKKRDDLVNDIGKLIEKINSSKFGGPAF
jgi:hypothetical protein